MPPPPFSLVALARLASKNPQAALVDAEAFAVPWVRTQLKTQPPSVIAGTMGILLGLVIVITSYLCSSQKRKPPVVMHATTAASSRQRKKDRYNRVGPRDADEYDDEEEDSEEAEDPGEEDYSDDEESIASKRRYDEDEDEDEDPDEEDDEVKELPPVRPIRSRRDRRLMSKSGQLPPAREPVRTSLHEKAPPPARLPVLPLPSGDLQPRTRRSGEASTAIGLVTPYKPPPKAPPPMPSALAEVNEAADNALTNARNLLSQLAREQKP